MVNVHYKLTYQTNYIIPSRPRPILELKTKYINYVMLHYLHATVRFHGVQERNPGGRLKHLVGVVV